MRVYNNFVVLETHPDIGHLTVAWYDDTRDAQGQLVTPLKQQIPLVRSHRIPVEAEQNNWTRDQLRQFWELEVEDVADIPQWADDEVGKAVVEGRTRLRRATP